MALVALKCPNCGGTVQFEDKMESGFCVHCGAKITNGRSSQVQIEKNPDVAGKLKEAKEALTKHEWDVALRLIDNILSADPNCLDAVYMMALLHFKEKLAFEDTSGLKDDVTLKNYGIFSEEDIKKCWGEFNLIFSFDYGLPNSLFKPTSTLDGNGKKAPTPNGPIEALVTIDGKESFIMKKKDGGMVAGVNYGKHTITACLNWMVDNKEYSSTEASFSFIASMNHEFFVTGGFVGMSSKLAPKIQQIS